MALGSCHDNVQVRRYRASDTGSFYHTTQKHLTDAGTDDFRFETWLYDIGPRKSHYTEFDLFVWSEIASLYLHISDEKHTAKTNDK